ncbi:MAG: DNA replication and repair protein RecF [Candidatus Poriferisodalaceae bacterium]
MRIDRLWLVNFRNHRSTDVEFDPSMTLVTGANGQGKTNLLEGIAMLAGMKSFRGAVSEAMVCADERAAVVRADVSTERRTVLVELEISTDSRSRMQVNKQAVRRARDLADTVRVVVFSPDDLELMKGSPSIRRGLLDDVVASVNVAFRQHRADLDRVLRQRNTLLKQAGGRPNAEIEATLEVWDAKLIAAADAVAFARESLVAQLEPVVCEYYRLLAGADEPVTLSYDAPWRDIGLAAALAEVRRDEFRRSTTLVGPHRDELGVSLNGLPARTHASQGEQRSLSLALRLATHRVLGDLLGDPPVVLLDDVFSELDDGRARRLVDCLPAAQTILTSATGTVPDGIVAGLHLTVHGGVVSAV